jgi:hypothetical protein
METNRPSTKALRRGALLLAVMAACAVLPTAVASAQTSTPTTYQGGLMGDDDNTGEKPQSKLWYHDGSWWALMNGQVDTDIQIHRLAPDHSWQLAGDEVDTRTSTGDALADGDKLYVISRRGGTAGTRLTRFTYSPATRRYARDTGYPVLLTRAPLETATIAKDSTGRLWAAWEAPDSAAVPRIWVTHSTTSDNTWAAPFVVPAADTAVTSDDIAAVVALDGKIGVMWSDQASDAFRFVTHVDGQPPGQWAPMETALGGLDMADDHINVKKAADGRLFAAVKTSRTESSSPRIMLLVRATNGTWSSHIHSTRGNGMTRPIVLLDDSARRVFMFAATLEGTGAQIYYKTTSMDAPAFGTGKGNPFVTWPGTTLRNATSTKQSVSAASGVVVLTGDRDTVRYYHGELR